MTASGCGGCPYEPAAEIPFDFGGKTERARAVLRKKGHMKPIVITIDGPAGAGKSTVSRALADRLGYRYVDTGALYRGVAHTVKARGVDLEDAPALEDFLETLEIRLLRNDDGSLTLLADGQDITGEIRTPEISMAASRVSAKPAVRAFLLGLQRKLGGEKAAVFEGRDMGTVVFPEAEVKFFLSADDEERARRRLVELPEDSGETFESVLADMKERDANDAGRAVAPLRPADDAIRIDSTGLGIEGVVEAMLAHVNRVMGA